MKTKGAALMLAAAAVSVLFFGCEMFRMDGADFSSALMRAVCDKGYLEQESKALLYTDVYEEPGLVIAEALGGLSLRATFTAWQRYNSTVTGTLYAVVSVETDDSDEIVSVTLTFSGTVEVTGKHQGTYELDNATVTYDFTASRYLFGGSVIIDGVDTAL